MPTENPLDMLTEDLSDVSTAMPLLKEGLYDLTLAGAEVKPTKDGTGNNLSLTWKTTKVAQDTKGEAIQTGFPLYDTIGMTPSDAYSPENIKRRLAAVAQALGVKTLQPFDALVGKVAKIKVIIEPERKDPKTQRTYDASNRIKQYLTD